MRNQSKVVRLISVSLVLLVFVSTLVKTPQVAAQSSASELQREEDSAMLEGVVSVDMNTDKGQIKLMQPSVILPGDTISGAVIDERKEVQAGDELSGAVVEINGQKQKLRNNILTFTVPAAAAAGSIIPFILKNKTGHEIARGKIPVSRTGLTGSIPTQLGNFAPPRIGQTGRELCIPGNFDGKAETTQISVGNQQAEFLVESRRMSAVKIFPNAPTGPTNLTIEDVVNVNGKAKQVSEQFKFNILSVELKADKLNLMRGESTNLHVSVHGLEGVEDNNGKVKLTLQNLSPQVIKFANSPSVNSSRNDFNLDKFEVTQNIISFIISSKKSNGEMSSNKTNSRPELIPININKTNSYPMEAVSFNCTVGLTGIKAGTFGIRAFLIDWGWIIDMMERARGAFLRKQLEKIGDLKRKAANRTENTDAQKELRKNADKMDALAGDKKYWEDGKLKDEKGFKKELEKEKKELDKRQKQVGTESKAGEIIGEAKDELDKALEGLK